MTKIFFILFIILSGQTHSQTNKLPTVNDSIEFFIKSQGCPATQKKYKTLHFFTYGLPFYSGGQCAVDLRKKYGFDEVMKAGCYVKRGQARRWERHNYRVETKMEKRHGENWRKKYDAELEKCLK